MQCNNLEEVRANIDRIDNEIIKLIAERGQYVSQAAAFKKNEEGVKDPSRVEKVIQKVRTKAELYGANPEMVEKLYRNMISAFIKMEMKEFEGDSKILLDNLDKIGTTEMGRERIKKNLKITNTDSVSFCVEKIKDPRCVISRNGKNWYCQIDEITITINARSYTIITAHKGK